MFTLQPSLAPHEGDLIYFGGVPAGKLANKTTDLRQSDYVDFPTGAAGELPYANVEVLASHIEPAELSQIWAEMRIDREAKSINVVSEPEGR